MATARQRVLAYLTKTRTASTREISRGLKMSAATVRHHLRILAADGRLEMSFVRGREGRGRPEKVYSLPRAAMGDNLSALGEAVLAEAGTSVQMEALAKRLTAGTSFGNQPIAKRLNLSVESLNKMNYHARWEAGSQGPRLIFGHCPYAALIEKHPELCKMDEALLEELMGDAAVQLFRIGRDGSSTCVFALGR
ncbi:MAG TPA: winged helix-turn-helix transcriptional regulator [Anaerolineales bacterium]|nr:winged helix-turn-helix transcriptional regulator [Anaerolineales bacterium]